jgi:hypothetical protein
VLVPALQRKQLKESNSLAFLKLEIVVKIGITLFNSDKTTMLTVTFTTGKEKENSKYMADRIRLVFREFMADSISFCVFIFCIANSCLDAP